MVRTDRVPGQIIVSTSADTEPLVVSVAGPATVAAVTRIEQAKVTVVGSPDGKVTDR